MSEAETLFGDAHVRRYRETDGEVGHIWKRGAKILLLTTKGRTTGEPRTAPLIYENVDGEPVIVASKGGAPEHPGWYRNLLAEPEVTVQILGDVFPAHEPVMLRGIQMHAVRPDTLDSCPPAGVSLTVDLLACASVREVT